MKPKTEEGKIQCYEHGCVEPAVYQYDWHGAGTRLACEAHGKRAVLIGSQLGLVVKLRLIAASHEVKRDRMKPKPKQPQPAKQPLRRVIEGGPDYRLANKHLTDAVAAMARAVEALRPRETWATSVAFTEYVP